VSASSDAVRQHRTWRSIVSRIINWVARPLGWWFHFSSDDCRCWFHREGSRRVNRPNAIREINFEAAWFRKQNGLACVFHMSDDFERTFQLMIQIPWLVSWWGTISMRPPQWIARRLKGKDSGNYGFSIGHECMYWEWSQSSMSSDGYRRAYYWYHLNGKQTVTTEVFDGPHVQLFEQPASGAWPSGVYEIVLSRQCMTWHWSRFWKRDQVRVSWDIRSTNPPPFEGKWGKDGIYGCSVDGSLSLGGAIAAYVTMVEEARKRYG
jgi:hypothetical protein